MLALGVLPVSPFGPDPEATMVLTASCLFHLVSKAAGSSHFHPAKV